MDGLKEILNKIESDNTAEINEYVGTQDAETQKMTDDIINAARVRADKIIADARKKADILAQNSKSSCEIYEKNQLLSEKLTIINTAVADAVEKLKNMESDEYFKAVERLALKYAHSGGGEILFNEGDIARLPDGFVSLLNEKLKEKKASISLAKDCAKIESGFVLRYGGIEENCSFDALIGEKRDEMRDKLFKEFE